MVTQSLSSPLTWGPLDTAIHDESHPPGSLPWKDNAYIAFWDPTQDVYGCLHVSTSPNAEGRRARLSFYAGGPNVEIIEPLERGTFNSKSIKFDLSGVAKIDHPRLQGELRFRPTTGYADFTAKALPALGKKPLHHYQITVAASGDLRLDGARIQHGGAGIRDRTWGFRDESANMPEFIWFFAAFPQFSVTALRFVDVDGTDRSDGFILDSEARRVITGISVTRDPSGLCAEGELALADGGKLVLRSGGRRAGFWLPMSWERKGPTMSAYDEFCPLTTGEGIEGFGVVEHGIIRKLF